MLMIKRIFVKLIGDYFRLMKTFTYQIGKRSEKLFGKVRKSGRYCLEVLILVESTKLLFNFYYIVIV